MSRTGILAGYHGKLALWSGNAADADRLLGRALGRDENLFTIRFGAPMHKHAIARPQGTPRHVGQPLQARLRPDFVGPALASRTTRSRSGPAGRMRSDRARGDGNCRRENQQSRKPHAWHA